MKQWDDKLSRKVIHTTVTIVVTLVLFGGLTAAYLFYKHDTSTTLQDNPGKQLISTVKATNAANKPFSEGDFTFNLPSDWKKTGDPTSGAFPRYSYQATKKNADNRFLYIYEDGNIPAAMAVDRVVSVQPQDSKLTHGEVSDNCADFTNRASPQQHTGPAKWDGVDFVCDMDNKAGDVIGTSSPGMVNKVELQNEGFTKHDFFFVYTDDNYTPDYGIFYNFLDSFAVK